MNFETAKRTSQKEIKERFKLAALSTYYRRKRHLPTAKPAAAAAAAIAAMTTPPQARTPPQSRDGRRTIETLGLHLPLQSHGRKAVETTALQVWGEDLFDRAVIVNRVVGVFVAVFDRGVAGVAFMR